MPEAVMEIVKDSYLANKDVCFGGDKLLRGNGTRRPRNAA